MKHITNTILIRALLLSAWLDASSAPAQSPTAAVVAWGYNDDNATVVPVAAQSGVTAIAAGGGNSVALKHDGTVVIWGRSYGGDTWFPNEVQGQVTAIAAAGVDGQYAHAMALLTNGSVIVWGSALGSWPPPVGAQSGVTAIAAGPGLNLALKANGSVLAWGGNTLFDQTNVPVAARSGVTAIAAGAGGGHVLALKSNGTVVAWGLNSLGQVTGGTPTAVWPYATNAYPVTLDGQVLNGVAALAAGSAHSVALKSNGTVVVWGGETWAGTGNVPVEAQSGVKAIAATGGYTLALKSNGVVVAWPDDSSYITSVPAAVQGHVTAIAAGNNHVLVTVALEVPVMTNPPVSQTVIATHSAHFTVEATGFYLNYQWRKDGVDIVGATGSTFSISSVQHGDAGAYSVVVSNAAGSVTSAPSAVLTVTEVAPAIASSPASRSFSVGQNASFAVTASGDPVFYQWRKDGVDLAGATSATLSLGIARTDLAGAYTVVVSNGVGTVTSSPPAVLTVNPASPGVVGVWGTGDSGQTNVPPAALGGVTAISAGALHVVALKTNGSVIAWGGNSSGQVNVPPAAQSGVSAVAAGGSHTLVLKENGSVLAWGNNGAGQAAVPLGAGSGVVAIAAGKWNHSLALKNDGSVVGWGCCVWNEDSPATVPVEALSGVVAIAAGSSHSVALKIDGSVVAWGGNDSGQSTVPPAAHSGVIAVAAGESHTVALKADGSVLAWGENNQGQAKVPVAAQSGVIAIAAGYTHTIALKRDGTVVAWGESGSGGATALFGLSGVTAIAAGEGYSGLLGLSTFSPPVMLLDESFNGSNGGFTVDTPQPYEGSWAYSAASGSWTEADTGPGIGEPRTSTLISPGITVPWAGPVQLTFAHRHSFQSDFWDGSNWDGGQVRLSINGGPFTLVPLVAFIQDGYNGTVRNDLLNGNLPALAGQPAYVGTSSDFFGSRRGSVCTLGSFLPGDVIRVAFMAGNSEGGAGIFLPSWEIDRVSVAIPNTPSLYVWRGPSGSFLVSWPTNATGFALQSALDPTLPANWLDVTNPPTVLGGQFTVTNAVSGGARFFRLIRP